MGVQIKINRLNEMARSIENGAKRILLRVAQDIETDVKYSMAAPKSGRAYQRGESVHIASAPGEAPAVDSGKLINSIRAEVIDSKRAVVAVTAEYGAYLEFGTRRMAPRPYLVPAAQRAAERLPKRAAAIVEVLR